MKRLILAALVALTASAATAIRGVQLFDGRRVIPKANVVFDGGVIVAAGADAPIPQDAEVIDGTGKTLMPGLIDAHTHAFGPALERALRFGVTTELDMFTAVDALKGWKGQQAAGNVTDRADIRSAGTLVTVKGGHGTEYFPIPTYSPGDDPQAFIDARVAEGSDYIKLVVETGEAFGAKLPTLSAGDLRALIAAAHKRKKMAVVHATTLAGARMAIEAGADGLVHLFGDQPPDAGFAKLAASHRTFVIPTLTVVESASGIPSGAALAADARLQPYLSAEETRGLKSAFPKHGPPNEDLGNATAALRQLKAAGVPILAGSDAPNPGTAHGASIHRELELLVVGGLAPVEALAAATSTPARLFHLDDRGRIAKGLRADLLLVDGDPTADIRATRNIAAVWRNGVPLARKPEPPSAARQAEMPPADVLASGVISNFDSGETKTDLGSGWVVSTDAMAGGKSTAAISVVDGGAAATPKALHISADLREGFAFPWAGAMAFLGSSRMKAVDLSAKKGISFFAKGNADIRVMLFAASLGRIPAQTTVHAGEDWTRFTVPWSDFHVDGKDVQAVLFSGAGAGRSEITIDELRLEPGTSLN